MFILERSEILELLRCFITSGQVSWHLVKKIRPSTCLGLLPLNLTMFIIKLPHVTFSEVIEDQTAKSGFQERWEWLLLCAQHCSALWFPSTDSRTRSPDRFLNLSQVPEKVNDYAEFRNSGLPGSKGRFYWWMVASVKDGISGKNFRHNSYYWTLFSNVSVQEQSLLKAGGGIRLDEVVTLVPNSRKARIGLK